MNPILLENLQKFEILESWNSEVFDPTMKKKVPCSYYKLKAKQEISFEDAKGLENGIRHYIEMNGYINYVSGNMAAVWLKEIMKYGDVAPSKKRNFGK